MDDDDDDDGSCSFATFGTLGRTGRRGPGSPRLKLRRYLVQRFDGPCGTMNWKVGWAHHETIMDHAPRPGNN
jgi:hypothetical protein